MIDVHRDPPTAALIREKQAEWAALQKVLVPCPDPAEGMVAELCLDAMVESFPSCGGAPWRDVPGALGRTWPADPVVRRYVEGVLGAGRHLVACEVEALEARSPRIGMLGALFADIGDIYRRNSRDA